MRGPELFGQSMIVILPMRSVKVWPDCGVLDVGGAHECSGWIYSWRWLKPKETTKPRETTGAGILDNVAVTQYHSHSAVKECRFWRLWK